MNKVDTAAKERIDQIDDALLTLTGYLDQEKADFGKLDWGAIGELGYIAEQLDELIWFWGSGSNPIAALAQAHFDRLGGPINPADEHEEYIENQPPIDATFWP